MLLLLRARGLGRRSPIACDGARRLGSHESISRRKSFVARHAACSDSRTVALATSLAQRHAFLQAFLTQLGVEVSP